MWFTLPIIVSMITSPLDKNMSHREFFIRENNSSFFMGNFSCSAGHTKSAVLIPYTQKHTCFRWSNAGVTVTIL